MRKRTPSEALPQPAEHALRCCETRALLGEGLRALTALCLILALTGCGSSSVQQHRYCMPKPDMTTRQLTDCGCLLHDSGGLASASEARAAGGADVQTVIIVNYICPLGEKGIARVSVANGVVDAVYY